jgi:hypothetical protein
MKADLEYVLGRLRPEVVFQVWALESGWQAEALARHGFERMGFYYMKPPPRPLRAAPRAPEPAGTSRFLPTGNILRPRKR